ncbi:MAG: GNAT family N-acetyltransferase, partial [Planctomycetota bacterium]
MVQLVELDPKIDQQITADPRFLEAMKTENWPLVASLVQRLVGRTLTAKPIGVDSLHWDGYYVVDSNSREVVGSCGFKGPPTDDGIVEIAYFTYPDYEGQGYATAMSSKLVQLAADCDE